MRRTSLLSNLMLFFGVCILCLILLEAISRVLSYHEPSNFPPILRSDDELCFFLTPNVSTTFRTREFSIKVRTNSLGFRDEREGFQGGSILVLGDSFIFGAGVEFNQSFSSKLQSYLSEKGHLLPVYNLGVGGYGTWNELLLLKRYIMDVKPKLVLLGFYPNDPRDNLDKCIFEVDNGFLVSKGASKNWNYGLKKWLHLNSNLYRLISNSLYELKVKTRIFDRVAHYSKLQPPVEYTQYSTKYDKPTEMAWNLTYLYLSEMQKLASLNRARLVVFFIPSKSQLNPMLQERLNRIYNLESPEFNKIQRNLAAFSKVNGIHFIDLTETFIKRNGTSNYFEIDPHWLPCGHAIAAEAVGEYLIKEGLI